MMRRRTMIGGETAHSLYSDLKGEENAVKITKTTDIYCGRSTTGYQVARAGLDVTFAPDLEKVYALINEYYNGRGTGFHHEEKD
jgi:hypothetical protein